MNSEATQRVGDKMSSPRVHPSFGAAHAEPTRLNRLVMWAWGSLVAVLFVAALAGTSFAQSSVVGDSGDGALKGPKPLNLDRVAADITYPQSARSRGHSGLVTAELLVDAQGQVIQYTIEGEAEASLKQAVSEQLSKLRFEPAERDGKPVRMYVSIPFAFVLR